MAHRACAAVCKALVPAVLAWPESALGWAGVAAKGSAVIAAVVVARLAGAVVAKWLGGLVGWPMALGVTAMLVLVA